MAFDFKKEYKEFYLPKNTPEIITVPPVNYAAVRDTEVSAAKETVAERIREAQRK